LAVVVCCIATGNYPFAQPACVFLPARGTDGDVPATPAIGFLFCADDYLAAAAFPPPNPFIT